MQFKDVIGQQELKKELPQLLQENRLAHALLFLGKEGSGALTLALAFAQYLVCERTIRAFTQEQGPSLFGEENLPKTFPNDACGECLACTKAQQYIHPDVHFSYPVIPKKAGTPPLSTDYIQEWREFILKFPHGNAYDWLQFIAAENKQGNITAAECNDIIRKLSLKSFESDYKVLIMWLPEYLGNEGNRLLKLIEEPPANTVFLFVAENASLILPTIISRCQLIKVPVIDTPSMEQALVNNNGLTHDAALKICGITKGNYREAIHMLQHADEDWNVLLREWLNAILKTGPIAQVKWVDDISKMGRENQKQFLRYFNHLLQQSIRLSVLQNNELLLQECTQKEIDFAQRMNNLTGFEQQQAIIEEVDKAVYYIERNANAKILFMALTIKLYHIIQDKIVFLTD